MSAAYRPNSGGSCCLQRCAHPFRHSAGHYFAQVFGAESFFDYSNTLRRSTAFAEIKQSADGHPHFGSCALHHHRSSMHEPDLGLPHKYRSAGATRVVDRNDRHLCTQPESPHGISAVDLQLPTVLPGNQIHQVPRPRTMNPTSVLTVFRPHVDATIHTLKLATANKLGDCLGDGRARTKPCKAPDAERPPLRRCFQRCATR